MRQVAGGGEETCCWHLETGKKVILGPDKKSIGAYKRTLSYVQKIKNRPGAPKRFRNRRLGWCMVEIGLEQQQLVLCKVYRSPRTDPDTSTEAIIRTSQVKDGQHGLASGMPCPAPLSSGYQVTESRTTLECSLHHSPVARTLPALPIGPVTANAKHRNLAIVKKAWVATPMTVVIKLGGSSIPSAERMKEMAKLILSFSSGAGESPVVVLSALGETTANILLAAGKALSCGTQQVRGIHELAITKELHLRTIDELGLDRSIVSASFYELEQHLQYVAMTKELTPRTRDYLVSFGEHASTKMFSEYLNKLGKGALQEWELCAVTTFGRGGSDLTATTIGRALGSREIQVWKDVDGVFTSDPKVCANAKPIPYLTYDEAIELRYFCEQSMQRATEGDTSVIVKNSYNPQAPGTMITKTRDMSKSILLTSIVLKTNITMVELESTSVVGQYAFVAKAFSIFDVLGISVDCVDTSEGKMSFALVPSKLLSGELIQLELDNVVEEFQKIATVGLLQHRSVISIIVNAQMSPFILEMALTVLRNINVEVQKVSQGSFKVTRISLVVHDIEAKLCVEALHSAFFELNASVPVNSCISGDNHPEAPLGMDPSVLEDVQMPTEGDNVGDLEEFFHSIFENVREDKCPKLTGDAILCGPNFKVLSDPAPIHRPIRHLQKLFATIRSLAGCLAIPRRREF